MILTSVLVFTRFTTRYFEWLGSNQVPVSAFLLSTRRTTRVDVREWILSDEGRKLSVKLAVREWERSSWLNPTSTGIHSCRFGGRVVLIRVLADCALLFRF